MIKKITDNISAVFTEDGFTSANCMLVEDDIRLMIDSGAGKVLREAGPERGDILLNSHHHIDHMGGNDYFPKAKILAHPAEEIAMQSCARLTATDRWNELMEEKNFLYEKEIDGVPNRLLRPFRIDGHIDEGHIIDCGHVKITTLLTPGHTAGHLSFFFADEGIVFTADLCLTKVGPWYGDSESVIDDFVASVKRIVDLKPKAVLTGHYMGILTENIAETFADYTGRIFKREEKIIAYLKSRPASINELAGMHFIYSRHPGLFELYWEKSMIEIHLKRLTGLGSVQKRGDGRFEAIK
jgi:glyoxylase-like metal-dependent hydrolase (beta-lactamase superfamily II)